MQSNNRDVASVWDMTQAIQHIQTFTNGLTFDEYSVHKLVVNKGGGGVAPTQG